MVADMQQYMNTTLLKLNSAYEPMTETMPHWNWISIEPKPDTIQPLEKPNSLLKTKHGTINFFSENWVSSEI